MEQTDGVGVSRLRKRVVFERLLARLQEVAPGRWYLKGGFALELRLGGLARTTKDVDIDWTVGEQEATELLLDAAALEMADRFEFDVRRAESSDDLAGGGQRWLVLANLAGREFERVAIDVGFAKPPVIEPETVASSQLLEFADIEPIAVPALAVEHHLAEKLHAYSRMYGGGQPSSRVKDLVDIVVMASTSSIEASRLRTAVRSIFDRRATHDVPAGLSEPPDDWTRPWAALAENVPADADLAAGYATAGQLWNPVLSGDVDSGTWDPTRRSWLVG
jgi:hypothetical protein